MVESSIYINEYDIAVINIIHNFEFGGVEQCNKFTIKFNIKFNVYDTLDLLDITEQVTKFRMNY